MAIVDMKIWKIRNDPKHPYNSNLASAAHRAAVEEMTKLYEEKERSTCATGRSNSTTSDDFILID